MSDFTKVIRSGDCQTICLPEKHRVDADALEISRHGDALVLSPHHRQSWSRLRKALDAFDA